MILILAGMLLRKASQKSLRRNSHATFPPLPASPPPPTRQIAPLPAHPSAPSAPDATAPPSPNSRRPSIPPPPPRRPPSAPPPSDSTPPQPLIGGANYSPSPHSRPPVARAANWDRSAPCEKVRAPSSHFPSRGGFPSIARSECPAPVCRRGTHLGSESRSRSRARAYAPRTHAPAAQNPFARGPGPA